MDTFKSENQSTTDLIGQNWQKLIDIIESRPDDNEGKSFDGGGVQRQYRTDENVLRALQDVKRLRQKDMPLFGHCPETDTFYTVVCSSCSMILMPHALKDHYDKRHSEEDKSFSAVDKQAIDSQNKSKSKKLTPVKLEKGEKPKKVKLGSGTELTDEILKDPKRSDKSKKVKPPERTVQPELEAAIGPRLEKVKQKNGSRFATELLPMIGMSPMDGGDNASESNDGKDLPKKKQKEKKKNERKTDKVFDPDKHCGVINDSGKPCVRSILCKVHQVALKRAVPNRSMTYDMLIRILKSQSDEEKVKSDNGLFRPKAEEKLPQESAPPPVKPWVPEQTVIKTEEPPTKRLKVKEEEMVEDEGDQSQFTLPSHLEALIDETLRTLKDVEENEPVMPMMPIPPKPEPILKWNPESAHPPQREPSPLPQVVLDDVPWHSCHPKPLATNTFGCRLIGGLMSTCKKLDTLRKHLQSVWTSSTAPAPSMSSCFNDSYSPNNKQNGCAATANVKSSFTFSKFIKKPSVQNKVTPLLKKTVPSPATKGTSVKRKRKTSASIIAPVQNTSNASEIISGLLISNTVPIQRTATAAVPAISTGVIPVNSITGNGVPLRLFQGSLPVIASTAPNQPATFIQLNLCPK
ncbi:UNVERIFIED_CONTAM: hypothetical protein PYX00_010606 [Menopon gallinae]|uniref:SCA7 domain-containing protein n=1 Tax=Menopon gallinae TaxID=328185 RepID=A0AAW2HG02_9NEOP